MKAKFENIKKGIEISMLTGQIFTIFGFIFFHYATHAHLVNTNQVMYVFGIIISSVVFVGLFKLQSADLSNTKLNDLSENTIVSIIFVVILTLILCLIFISAFKVEVFWKVIVLAGLLCIASVIRIFLQIKLSGIEKNYY